MSKTMSVMTKLQTVEQSLDQISRLAQQQVLNNFSFSHCPWLFSLPKLSLKILIFLNQAKILINMCLI